MSNVVFDCGGHLGYMIFPGSSMGQVINMGQDQEGVPVFIIRKHLAGKTFYTPGWIVEIPVGDPPEVTE